MTGLNVENTNATIESLGKKASGEDSKLGEHSKLTFEEVKGNGEPMDPLQEDEPEIFWGKRDVRVRVIPADGAEVRNESVYLKRTQGQCTHVYRRMREKKPIDRVQFGGSIIFALRMDKVEGHKDLFREPKANEVDDHKVAIKKQSLQKIDYYLSKGHHENPYTAISRMQQIGDDVHVLGCIEALKDEKNLYTIMKCCDGSIMDMIQTEDGAIPEAQARESIMKVWKNLHYLQEHGVVHHDLSPDNVMSLKGNLLLTDLAMSLQTPRGPFDRPLLKPQGRYGKDSYMSPEVFISRSGFDGFGLDVWSSGCILYNLLTAHHLYHQPFPTDTLFKYFILAKGLSNTPMNERTIEVTIDVFQGDKSVDDRQPLIDRAMAQIQLSPTVIELMEKMFEINPAKRYSLAQCMESSWAKGQKYLYMGHAKQ